jgi:ATP-dependent RNA helicase RhlE
MTIDSTSNPWEALKLSKALIKAVEEEGFAQPTEIQQKTIPLIRGGQEVIGIAQTGTGKTAAYMLPILLHLNYQQGNTPRALVLAPTKELVIQLVDHAKLLSQHTDLRITAIYGGVGPTLQIKAIEAGIDLLVATPGRFMELYFKKVISTKQIKMLVLDEADRMMDMGFMPQLRKIFEVIPSKRQNLLFSATFSAAVDKLSKEFIMFPVRVEVSPPATAAVLVEQSLYPVPNLKTKINFLKLLLEDALHFNRVIIFTRNKATADNVFKFIERKGLGPAKVIHSNKGQNTRINAVNEFKEGKLRILVSTDVASRGIDVSHVSHVINFDVPRLYEDYIHRIGRTGRASSKGSAITLATKAELYHIEKIEELMRKKIPRYPLPEDLVLSETPFEESQEMAMELDRQRRAHDPEFKGAFHKSKRDKN